MKTILFILITLFSQQGFACSCAAQSPLTKLATSEFVATVKILNINKDKLNTGFNDVEIEILELYKGENISTLKNYGTDEAMCGVYTPKDTVWLIYAYRGNDGNLRYDLCSGATRLDKEVDTYNSPIAQDNYNIYVDSILELLDFLKDKKIQFNDEYGLRTYISQECLNDFNGINVKSNRFALYELTIDSDLNIKTIDTLKEFGNNRLKGSLLSCVSKNMKVFKEKKQMALPEKTKIIVGLFYNPASDDIESYISQWGFGY